MINEGDEDRKIKQAVEDADRIIYFAAQGKIDDQTDLICLEKLTKATFRIKNSLKMGTMNEEDVANFFLQLSIMSHVLYPVTAESLRVMESMNWSSSSENGDNSTSVGTLLKRFIRAPMLLALVIIVFIFGLVVTPYVFIHSMEGASIIERLDSTLKNITALRKELIAKKVEHPEGLKSEQPQENGQSAGGSIATAQSEASGSKKAGTDDIVSLTRRLEVQRTIQQSSINHLEIWNNTWLGRAIIHANASLSSNENGGAANQIIRKDDQQPAVGKDENKQQAARDAHVEARRLADIKLENNLKIKNTGLLILQDINGSLMLLLFGLCGALAFVLKNTIQTLQAHTFTGIRYTTFLRILLGTFCGFFLGYLGGNKDLLTLLAWESETQASTTANFSQVSSLTLAFIGGYSVDLLFGILNRFIYAVTNDDRYLPASEIVRRKVDVNKLMTPPTNPPDTDLGKIIP